MEHQDSDRFRWMEKRIKRYCKDVTVDLSKLSKRQKLKLCEARSAQHDKFSWDEVVDVTCTSSSQRHNITSSASSELSHGTLFDLSTISPGLYLVSQALNPEAQVHWAKKAVEEYSTVEHNNLTNLSSLYGMSSEPACEDESVGGESHVNKDSIPNVEDLWVTSCNEPTPFQTFAKLRWSCLGYHYDWTQRMYQRDLKSPFPADLAHLCASFAAQAGQALTPEAGIVNYYPSGTTMGGHLDDAELTMDHPIVSISIGLSALFLIGTRSRGDAPTPILLRSGDVVIMSGESRYCYHGIPVILPADFESRPHGTEICSTGALPRARTPVCDLSALEAIAARSDTPASGVGSVVRYLQQARINMNVRQVRPTNMKENEWIVKCGTGAATVES